MTRLWVLDVKSLDDDCSFLHCTSVWSIPDSSRSGIWNEFKIQAKSITDEEILKYISRSVASKDTWIHKVYETHRVSPKSLCCQRASRGSSFLLHSKWSPWSIPVYTWGTSSKASSVNTWKLFTLPILYHLSFVLALHHFFVWPQIKHSNKWCCIYFYSDCISFYLWRFKSKDYIIALFMKSENLKEKTD